MENADVFASEIWATLMWTEDTAGERMCTEMLGSQETEAGRHPRRAELKDSTQ